MIPEKQPEVDEIALLCGEEEVTGYTVKGWTLRQFQALLPILLAAVKALKDMGVTWDDIGMDQSKTLEIAQTTLEVLAPRVVEVLAISLNIPEEEAGDLDLATATLLLVKVVGHNIEHLKNLPARLMATVLAMSPGGS